MTVASDLGLPCNIDSTAVTIHHAMTLRAFLLDADAIDSLLPSVDLKRRRHRTRIRPLASAATI